MPGFTEHLDSGAQVFSIVNTYLVKANLSTTQTLGYIREKTYATNEQPFGPKSIPGGNVRATSPSTQFGSELLPRCLDRERPWRCCLQPQASEPASSTSDRTPKVRAPNTGVFQNRHPALG